MYDPFDAVGRLMFNVLAMVAEFEADLIRLRTTEGMKVAKVKGRLHGKHPKLTRRQEAHLVSLLHGGEYGTAEGTDLFNVVAPPSTERSNGNAPRPKPTSIRLRHKPRTRSASVSPTPHPCGTPTLDPALDANDESVVAGDRSAIGRARHGRGFCLRLRLGPW